MKRLPLLLTGICLLLAGGVSACGGPADAPAAKTVVSNGGTYSVSFETTPAAIPMNEPFTVVFRVSPKSGGAPGEPKVEIDARMPAHGHGMNRVPKVTRLADGTVKAEGLLFHMPGHWELYVDITQGGVTERAQFDVHLK